MRTRIQNNNLFADKKGHAHMPGQQLCTFFRSPFALFAEASKENSASTTHSNEDVAACPDVAGKETLCAPGLSGRGGTGISFSVVLGKRMHS